MMFGNNLDPERITDLLGFAARSAADRSSCRGPGDREDGK